MTSKLIERLINKEYLTERERKEWLGIIKERLEELEKMLIQTYEVNKAIKEKNGRLEQENSKLKKATATIKEHVQFIIKPIESNDPVLEGVYHFGIKVDGKYGYYTTLYKDEAIPLKEVLGECVRY